MCLKKNLAFTIIFPGWCCPFEKADTRVYLYIDRSKGGTAIGEFNRYIETQLEGRLDPNVPLDIFHRDSCEIKPLQAADLFSWGFFRKYEKEDTSWYRIFSEGKKNEL